jgi:hypothetical protein
VTTDTGPAANPSGDLQPEQHDLTDAVLNKQSIAYRSFDQGIRIGGGTPNRRWIDVHLGWGGHVMKVLAASQGELDRELGRLTSELGIPRAVMVVDRLKGWPFAGGFPFLGSA